jgi:arylsulfatase A-like enzyme/tetratricopeptide (TPR) repeat protein
MSNSRRRPRGRAAKSSGERTRAQASAPPTPRDTSARTYLLATLVAIVALGLIGFFAWRSLSTGDRQPALASGSLRGDNVLLITIDTLRQDRLDVYGNPNGLTPNLDQLANAGVRFAHAFSEVPETLPAHTSILTGLTPRDHGIHSNGTFRLGAGPATMATLLKQAGYRTGAFVAAFVLDARYGLNRGFDHYDDYYGQQSSPSSFYPVERTAPEVLAPALEWILGAGTEAGPYAKSPAAGAGADGAAAGGTGAAKPFFAWVHLYDPHVPYNAPADFQKGHTPYDAEVAYTDAMLGRFFDELRSRGILDHTLVVVTADHGESLGDHGEQTHGLFAYDSTLAIPLILSAPHMPPQVVSRPVADIDILPTVLDLTGVTTPGGLDGRSLVPAMAGDATAEAPPIYFEALDANLTRGWAPLTGVIAEGWKYIDLPIPELYHLDADPKEQHNLADSDGEKLREMQSLLKQITSKPAKGSSAERATVSSDTEARLQSLGYVSGADHSKKTYTEADDPKTLVKLNDRFTSALQESSTGQTDKALAGLRAVLAERPDFEPARTSAVNILLAGNQATEAVKLIEAAPGGAASSPALLAKLGAAQRAAGNRAAAAKAFEQAIADGSRDPDVYNDLGVIYVEMGRVDAARAMWQKLLTFDPTSAGAWNNLGILAMSSNDLPKAAEAFRHAVAADPSYAEAWHALGSSLVSTDPGAAVDAWQHALRLMPNNYDLLYNLGVILSRSSQPQAALPYLQQFIKGAPPEQYGADIAQMKKLVAEIQKKKS